MPASLLGDPGLGIKLAGTVFTAFLLVCVRASLVRLGLRAASVWPFLLLFAAPNVLYHFTMTRPHVVTTGLSALLFGLLVAPGGTASTFACALALTAIHLSLGWMAAVVLGAVLLVRAFVGAPLELGKAAAVIGGAAAGALARPHPIGALKIAWTQIFGLMIARGRGEQLLLGKELYPITADVVVRNLLPMIALWGLAGCLTLVALRRGLLAGASERAKILIGSSVLLSLVFFAMIFTVARRSFAPWALFAVVLMAAVVTFGAGRHEASAGVGTAAALLRPRAAGGLLVACAGLGVFMAVAAIVRNGRDLAAATPPDGCRAAAEWIAAHGRPGDVVYNVDWDAFPKLFVWNDRSRYINGMDPIFEYAFDRRLYYESFHVQLGVDPAVTCGWARCTPQSSEDTYTVMRRDFQASWLFLDKARSPALYAWARSDPRFTPGFENESQAVFGLETTQTRPR